jgi:hypothetical protein
MTYFFVIHTDQYTGNFERQLCAYLTGQVGECEVGSEMAQLAEEQEPEWVEWCDTQIEMRADDRGCYRPVSIYPTPGWFNSGMGDVYPDSEWGMPHVIKEYENACKSDKESIKKGPGRYQAYNSVVIYFNELPSLEKIKLMKHRACMFADSRFNTSLSSSEQIIGFRIVKETIIVEDITKNIDEEII